MKRFVHITILVFIVGLFSSPAFSPAQPPAFAQSSTLTKGEFAKELAQTLGHIDEDTEGCYSDVREDHEFAPYICGLKSAKVFRGGSRSFFRPQNTATWNDAIRGFCRGEAWLSQPTYRSCKNFAQAQELFAEPLPKLIRAQRTIKREDVALFFDRAAEVTDLDIARNNAEVVLQSPSLEPPKVSAIPPRGLISSPSFSPVAESNIATNFFENVTLQEVLPNRFYQNEVYTIEGNLSDASEDEVLIFLCKDTSDCSDSTNFLGDVTNGRFRVPVHFRGPGNFQIGIIPGRRGTSRVATISVLPKVPNVGQGTQATDLAVAYNQGQTRFTWQGDADITQLVFFQNNLRKDFIFRQSTNEFIADPEDFKDFKPGAAYWFVMSDSAESEIQGINLAYHRYREIDNASITVRELQESFSGVGRLTFRGEAKRMISSRAAVTKPDGFVTDINFAQEDITPGETFTFSFDLEKQGTYIFEINDTDGKAVVNVPIYVNSGEPILPDFFDLHDPVLKPNSLISPLDSLRTTMLTYINDARRSHGLEPVTIHPDLNITAQAHSADMKQRNFFAHVNPDGLSPDDRRKAAGISTPIRENLARSSSLEFAHEGLLRSPIHRDAILDTTMKRVGIGIAQDSEGYIYVTEHFAPNPITSGDLLVMRSRLLQETTAFRNTNNLPPLTSASQLEAVATQWSERMADEDFFGLTAPDGTKLVDVIRNSGILTSVQVHALQATNLDQLSEQIVVQQALANGANRNIGIGLAVNSIGEIFLTVIYTP